MLTTRRPGLLCGLQLCLCGGQPLSPEAVPHLSPQLPVAACLTPPPRGHALLLSSASATFLSASSAPSSPLSGGLRGLVRPVASAVPASSAHAMPVARDLLEVLAGLVPAAPFFASICPGGHSSFLRSALPPLIAPSFNPVVLSVFHSAALAAAQQQEEVPPNVTAPPATGASATHSVQAVSRLSAHSLHSLHSLHSEADSTEARWVQSKPDLDGCPPGLQSLGDGGDHVHVTNWRRRQMMRISVIPSCPPLRAPPRRGILRHSEKVSLAEEVECSLFTGKPPASLYPIQIFFKIWYPQEVPKTRSRLFFHALVPSLGLISVVFGVISWARIGLVISWIPGCCVVSGALLLLTAFVGCIGALFDKNHPLEPKPIIAWCLYGVFFCVFLFDVALVIAATWCFGCWPKVGAIVLANRPMLLERFKDVLIGQEQIDDVAMLTEYVNANLRLCGVACLVVAVIIFLGLLLTAVLWADRFNSRHRQALFGHASLFLLGAMLAVCGISGFAVNLIAGGVLLAIGILGLAICGCAVGGYVVFLAYSDQVGSLCVRLNGLVPMGLAVVVLVLGLVCVWSDSGSAVQAVCHGNGTAPACQRLYRFLCDPTEAGMNCTSVSNEIVVITAVTKSIAGNLMMVAAAAIWAGPWMILSACLGLLAYRRPAPDPKKQLDIAPATPPRSMGLSVLVLKSYLALTSAGFLSMCLRNPKTSAAPLLFSPLTLDLGLRP
ncbi:hypothetical protein PAPYR_6896 [Paratrimastix pyriformis]|uniref:Transmembrane protein n=1 Tax=Paratrimastix pyriformis TaxID=342808 RepID=A0ABQ8UJL6_9EUKA|nr:hypothetical protein PAPYR_6896 [Paratrimastix pyriformis]